jgi:hypothetical protein
MLVILRVGLLQGQLSLSLSLYVCVCVVCMCSLTLPPFATE